MDVRENIALKNKQYIEVKFNIVSFCIDIDEQIIGRCIFFLLN